MSWQGGCLSPVLFAVYVDNIIQYIQKHCLGCHIGLRSMGVIMYADDLLLISGSVTDLQAMINICMTELNSLDLTVNTKKSVCIRIGKNCKASCSNVSIESIPIPWSNRLSYLGITIQSSFKFIVDLKECRAKFYRSFNYLCSKKDLANEYMIVSSIRVVFLRTFPLFSRWVELGSWFKYRWKGGVSAEILVYNIGTCENQIF